ncbi:hypothetical protein NLI96_g8112 [Meripilus lineatus]|uniref:Protein kinase domain-containing protein n=1 Tax=Meripilus lineatus TaxID=2056292 RepID=A0AAD5YGI7_9APHY|nr:hypothetical protein NLI96_g8112 [Physisporinus lineatus]
MMDPRPSFPKMFHPVKISRSRDFKSRAKFYTRKRPTQYMFIDFGLSVRFQPGQEHQAIPVFGGDKTVPEFVWKSRKLPYDPFPADVYYLGNLIREEFLQKAKGVEFIEPLVADMVQDDPTKRPTMDEVVSRYDKMMRSLSHFQLRSRLAQRDEGPWCHSPFPHFSTASCRSAFFGQEQFKSRLIREGPSCETPRRRLPVNAICHPGIYGHAFASSDGIMILGVCYDVCSHQDTWSPQTRLPISTCYDVHSLDPRTQDYDE